MAMQPIHPTKICTKCGLEKPATTEHYPPSGAGLRARCRPCWSEYERQYFWRNRERKREQARCSRERQDKSVRRQQLMDWRAANPDKVRASELRRNQRNRVDPEARAKAAEKVRNWRQRNPEKEAARRKRAKDRHPHATAEYSKRYYARHRDRCAAKDRRYREENYEKVIACVERRRARELTAEGEFTGRDIIALIRQFGRTCFYCGASKLKKFDVDHFIPLARGGSNWPSNLVISCKPCNASKGAKMPWEWQPARFSEGCAPR